MTVLGDRIEQEILIAAPADFVFRFFTEPARHTSWLGLRAELDPRPGGVYRCVVNSHSTVLGEYVEVSPYEHVSFTWGFEGSQSLPPGSSKVSITLIADGPRTVVRLVHTGLPASMVGIHAQGWTGYLADLQTVIARDLSLPPAESPTP
jgi:uncharacterized protein YndB with AHSA1/START domain